MSDSQKLYKKKHFSCNRGSPDPNLFRSEHVRLNGEEKEKPVDLADDRRNTSHVMRIIDRCIEYIYMRRNRKSVPCYSIVTIVYWRSLAT